MTIISKLGDTFNRFVEKHICTPINPSWNDDQYHPTVNFVADKTGWHPAWIEEKLSEGLEQHLLSSGSRETLDDVTPRTIINYLKDLKSDRDEVAVSSASMRFGHSI